MQRSDRLNVVVLSADDYEALEATLELLTDPAAQQRVIQAQADIAAGYFVTGDQMAQLMADRMRREGHVEHRRDAYRI